MTATTDRCPGCHGSGIEMSGVTYAGMSEYVGCHECGPECPDDCGCRASDATERPESIAPRHPGATQSPDGSPRAAEGLRGAEGPPDPCDAAYPHASVGRCALLAGHAGAHDASDVRPSPPARDAVTLGYDEASRVPVLLAEKAALMGDVDRLTAERDGARLMQVIATRAFETTRRVLQEASGLPDDIDDPDCRDEMVLALRPRAEKAEAEVARLREGIEALATEMQSDSCPACHAVQEDDWTCDHAEGMQHAGDLLRALLAEGGE